MAALLVTALLAAALGLLAGGTVQDRFGQLFSGRGAGRTAPAPNTGTQLYSASASEGGPPASGRSASGRSASGRSASGRSASGRLAWERRPGRFRDRFRDGESSPAADTLPLLVYQMAALLEAGRSPHALWSGILGAWQLSGDALSDTPASRATDSVTAILTAAERAAGTGHSVSGALRAAAEQQYGHQPRRGLRVGASGQVGRRVWLGLADCWDVAERSGAPLARILARYGAQLEAENDANAARTTALAGPQATVKLLNWLPLCGLGLGLLMGANPLDVLLGSATGWGILTTGAAFMLAGRRWSHALVAAAAKPID